MFSSLLTSALPPLDTDILPDVEFRWLPEWQLVCGGDDLVCLFFHSAEDKPAACIAKDGYFFWNNLRAQTSESIFLSFRLSEEVGTEIVHRRHCLSVSLSVLCTFWHSNENRTQFICTKHSSIRVPRVLWPLSSDYWQREACWQNTEFGIGKCAQQSRPSRREGRRSDLESPT